MREIIIQTRSVFFVVTAVLLVPFVYGATSLPDVCAAARRRTLQDLDLVKLMEDFGLLRQDITDTSILKNLSDLDVGDLLNGTNNNYTKIP